VFSRHKALKINLIHFDKERKMSKSFKVAALVAVTAMFLAAPVFAPSVFGQSSPTGTATAGVFTTDVEDSMDVHYYSGVEFDKWAGFIGYDGLPSLGYATRFGDIYLGAWYNGSIASTSSNTESKQVATVYDLNSQLTTTKTTTWTYNNQITNSNNKLNVLLGVAGMGIKVGFYENLAVSTNPDTTVTLTETVGGNSVTHNGEIIEYSSVSGSMVPSLEWGMSLEAGDIVIRPKFGVDFTIYQDNVVNNTRAAYTTVDGELVGDEVTNRTGNNNGYLYPSFTVGAGFDLSSGATIGIEYGLGFSVYNNSYDASGFSGTAAGTVEWSGASTTISRAWDSTVTTTTGTLTIDEKTSMSHSITPSFYYSTDEIADGLSLGFYAELPVTIGVSSSNPSWKWSSITKTEYDSAVNKPLGERTESVSTGSNGLTETTQFSIGLNAAVGASYALIPGRFKVNAGIGISPCAFTSTTTKSSRGSVNQTHTEKTYDADGKLISETVELQENAAPYNPATSDTVTDRTSVANTWDPFSIEAAGGFTFNFNENIALDMVVNSGNAAGNFVLDITNVQVLFSFKF
jgi:hypothetical protein